jgi:predicted Fe-Mo cluster-binding NifX family protein
MGERLVIPTLDGEGLQAQVSEHFGRAPYFTVVDLNEQKEVLRVEVVANSGAHFGGQGHPTEGILAQHPQVVITRGMGPRAFQEFAEARVVVLQSNAVTVEEAIATYREGRLQKFTEGCDHHHRG